MPPAGAPQRQKPVIYQLVVRLFGNTNETRAFDGTLDQNGCGKLADVDDKALAELAGLGATHVWLTGVLRQATLTDWSAHGMPPDEPDVVKGRAGSFYAVRDYYDVCPDYAVDPAARMREFEELVARTHRAGLRVLIDFVPNHVARGYGSVVRPERDFGRHDDQTKFFARDNAFFYLVDPPGRALALAKPAHWQPAGVTFRGSYGREDGAPGRIPRATGNNVTSTTPSATDWYETVKLNYGQSFANPQERSFEPIPATWWEVDAILAYWQERGVDGFRFDFAHWVPNAAWRFLTSRARERDPSALLVAEAYDDLTGLLEAGFDAVYHDAAYDCLKRIYLGKASLHDLDRLLGSLSDDVRGRFLHYLENHDERRIASPIVAGDDPDASGFGTAAAGRQLAPILLLYNEGPVLVYNGQEVGEPARFAEGFSGEDGRTSIFDYGNMPELSKWVNGHRYDGGRLSEEQRALRSWYADLLALCQAPEVTGEGYWGLHYLSAPLYAFARFSQGGGSILVVAAGFTHGGSTSGSIRIPRALAERAALPEGRLQVRLLLDGGGKKDTPLPLDLSSETLATEGFAVNIADQSSHVYRIGRAAST